ncbi:PLAT/LH2 domain [Trinorchestia longiramus]|nr:PLAT/LH2 domain [Trinorchestia longiramus]
MSASEINLVKPNSFKDGKTSNQAPDSGEGFTLSGENHQAKPLDGYRTSTETDDYFSVVNNSYRRTSGMTVNSSITPPTLSANGIVSSTAQVELANPKLESRDEEVPSEPGVATQSLMNEDNLEDESRSEYEIDSGFQEAVLMFRSMTTTGVKQPVLVLYTYVLDRQATYLLNLATTDKVANSSGLSQELLKFSPQPDGDGCYIRLADDSSGTRFVGTCYQYESTYYPVIFQWSYHHTRLESKTIFYHGSLPEIEFQLPPGLETTNYEMYVTIKILDGKGVSKTLETKSVLVPPRHNSGDGVIAIFNEISKMELYNPGLELEQVRSLAWELNSIENSVISQTVFDNIMTIIFYRESCMESLETVTEDPNDAISDNSVVESLYKVNMLKSCARDHLAEIACASVIRDEMEILQVETTLAVVLGAPEFISSKTFFRVVDAMWRMQKQHMQLWDYRTEIRSEVAKQYFSLVSTVLDKQYEIYDLSVVSVNTTNELILSLMRVMGKEVRSRFLEESPLRYSTSTLDFVGFLTEGNGIASDHGEWMFKLGNTSTGFARNAAVLCLVHLKTPYMLADSHAVDVSTDVLHLRLGSSERLANVEVRLPRSPFLTHSEYDFRRTGTILPERLNVYELEVTKDHERLPLHIQLEVVKVYGSEYLVAPIALICKDMQSLDNPTHVMRLSASNGPDPGQVLFVAPGDLHPGSYVLVIMDQNTYDNRWSRRVKMHDGAGGGGAEYVVSGWWSDCLVWNVSSWEAGECEVLQSVWNIMSCRCSSHLSTYGGVLFPILNEQDTMNVNELMLMRSYCALYFIMCVLVVYVVLAVSLTSSAGLNTNRHNIWLPDNQSSHHHSYLLTIKTGTQKHAGTSAKVFAILHGTDSMSDTRELQSSATTQLFVRGSVCSFIITTEQALGNILKVQLWHNNRGDECKKLKHQHSKPSSSSSASADNLSTTDGTSDEVSEPFYSSTISSLRRSSITASGDCPSLDLAREHSRRSSATSDVDFDRISIARSSSVISDSGDSSDNNPSNMQSGPTRDAGSSSESNMFAKETSKTNSKTDKTVPVKKFKSSSKKKTCCSSYPTCGNDASWFVCEVKVSELRTGAFFDFPCYQWLSVTENDTKVECEISLETPTTFWQDVEHFLPQYANENVVWTSLRSMSHSVRFYRLQRLTICLVVVLGLGAASLTTVKRINTSHTMMTPDLHLEPLLYGFLLAPLLMPIQWILEILFKASNRQEEKQASIVSARKTIENLKSRVRCHNHSSSQNIGSGAFGSRQQDSHPHTEGQPNSNQTSKSATSTLSVLSTKSKEWKTMVKWAENFTVDNTSRHNDFLENLLRRRTNARSSFDALLSDESRDADEATSPGLNEELGFAKIFGANTNESLSGYSQATAEEVHVAESVSSKNCDGKNEFLKLENLLEENSILYERGLIENDDNATWRIALRILSWVICVVCGGVCCLVLLVRGADMPVDYSSLWLQIIYSTLCTSVIVIQPLIIALYTIYRVIIYRFYQGCRGCISSCMSFPLEQSIAIWRQYRAAFGPGEDLNNLCGRCEACVDVPDMQPIPENTVRSNHHPDGENLSEDNSTSEEPPPQQPSCTIHTVQQIERLARARELRFARPPPETVLLKCRLRRLKRQMITRFLAMFLRYMTFLCLLLVIMSHTFINQKNIVNTSLKNSILNGTCLLEKDEYYVKFSDLQSKDDWWEWATSELMGLAYNYDADYTSKKIFCDSNSIIIGNPRIRLYSVGASQCSASDYVIAKNESITSTLGINDCYLEYQDPVRHLANFLGVTDKKYEWDAHYLAVLHGLFSHYSYSKHEYFLPDGEFGALLYLVSLRAFGWVADYESSRALVTEFTVYHPQYNIYSSIYYLAEFPSSSGAAVKVGVASTSLQRYKAPGAYPTMFAECLLLPVAMFLMIKSFLYLYHCGFKVWKSFWGFLDIFLTILVWSYIICLMLRVQIAEDLMWQLKVSYFEKFVNLKGVMEWDSTISSILGFIMFIHILRCLWLFSFFSTFRRLGLILSMAMADISHITGAISILIFAFLNLGYIRLNSFSDDYYSVGTSFITVFALSACINVEEVSVENFPPGATLFFNFYRAAIALMIVLFSKAYYFAAFSFAFKSYSHHERPVEISVVDIFSFMWAEIRNIFPRKKSDETQEISDETVPSTLYVSELHGQLNEVLDRLDAVCCNRGISRSHLENTTNNSSNISSIGSEDRLWDNVSRRSCQYSSLESSDVADSIVTKHVDGMTDVPSFTSETQAAKNLVAGLRIFNSESIDNSSSSQRQLIYNPHSEHLTKFLRDVRSASDGNLAGSSFGKYGKHTKKIKSQENELSSPLSNSDIERCIHSRNGEKCTVCTNLRKTETLGLDRNTEELDI